MNLACIKNKSSLGHAIQSSWRGEKGWWKKKYKSGNKRLWLENKGRLDNIVHVQEDCELPRSQTNVAIMNKLQERENKTHMDLLALDRYGHGNCTFAVPPVTFWLAFLPYWRHKTKLWEFNILFSAGNIKEEIIWLSW